LENMKLLVQPSKAKITKTLGPFHRLSASWAIGHNLVFPVHTSHKVISQLFLVSYFISCVFISCIQILWHVGLKSALHPTSLTILVAELGL
jgi:hypothetical protein